MHAWAELCWQQEGRKIPLARELEIEGAYETPKREKEEEMLTDWALQSKKKGMSRTAV